MRLRWLILALLVLPAIGCNPSPMTSQCAGGSTSALVTGAALFRLEVYGAAAHCAGHTLAPGAGIPVAEHSYAAGEPITLETPNGPHTLILTAYADAAGTKILGVGCLEVTLPAGSQLCFDVTLVPPAGGSDGGVSTCGNQGQACCPGATPCNANLGCVGGTCVCGGMNQPCCFGSACQFAYCCINGTCQF